jgi:hypothetical protein
VFSYGSFCIFPTKECSPPCRLSFLDRTNIGNAKLFRLQEDLGMPTKGPGSLQYNTALAVFFPFYVAAEIPSNMMMKRLRPSLWLTIIMLSVSSPFDRVKPF